MRAAVLSTQYADPAHRGKLHALLGLDVAVAALVPERWTPPRSPRPVATTRGGDGGVEIVPIPTRGAGLATRWDARALRRFLTEYEPDLLQIEAEPWTPAAAVASGLARRLGIPTVLVTLDALPRRLSWRDRLRRRRVLAAARGVIAGSTLAAGQVGALAPQLARTIIPQLGTHPPVSLGATASHVDFTIGFVGRIVHERGLDLLLRAAARLRGEWSLLVAGNGPAQEPLERLAERLGIAARITWLGALARAELATTWRRLDCLALPARATDEWVETGAQAVVEAMAFGVPVVVSDSGVLPETVGPAGYVVPEDNATALADILQLLHDSPAERGARARAGRERVLAHYAHDAVARQTHEYWDRVLARS
jgi:glycosyltransferase involved in cell wall biosynthesis